MLIACFALGLTSIAKAAYKETMDLNGVSKNLRTDYGLVDDNAKRDQSALLQKAINNFSKKGGGRLIIPKGTYSFANIFLDSNVHLLIEKDTVIKPDWPKWTKVTVFNLTPIPSTSKKDKKNEGYIENVSIRGLGGSFIVDYSDRERDPNEGMRAINCRQVKNFLISDVFIKDSWTTFAAVEFNPLVADNAGTVEVPRPTDGLVKNLKCTDTSAGYGLIQMRAGESIHFENLWTSNGGVTFRLETGGGRGYGGIYNITAKDIYCENGLSAVCMGPHTAKNGLVMIDGVTAVSCLNGVQMGPGFVSHKANRDGANATIGRFADGSTVKNIHVVFGTNAPVSLKAIGEVPKEYLKDLRWEKTGNHRLRGPSLFVVKNSTGNGWKPVIQNVTSEGFKYNDGVVELEKEPRANYKEVLKGYPVLNDIPDELDKNEQSGTDENTGETQSGKKKKKRPPTASLAKPPMSFGSV